MPSIPEGTTRAISDPDKEASKTKITLFKGQEFGVRGLLRPITANHFLCLVDGERPLFDHLKKLETDHNVRDTVFIAL